MRPKDAIHDGEAVNSCPEGTIQAARAANHFMPPAASLFEKRLGEKLFISSRLCREAIGRAKSANAKTFEVDYAKVREQIDAELSGLTV